MNNFISVSYVDRLPPDAMPVYPCRRFDKEKVIQAALSRPSTSQTAPLTENMPPWQVKRLTAASWFAFNESTNDDAAGSITDTELRAVQDTFNQASWGKLPTRIWSHATKEQKERIFRELLSRNSGLCMIVVKNDIDAEWKDYYPDSEFAQLVRQLLAVNKSIVSSESLLHGHFFLWDAADFRRRSNLLQLSEEFRTEQPRIFAKLRALEPSQIGISGLQCDPILYLPEVNQYVQYNILLGREFQNMNEYLVKTGLMDCPFALERFTDNLVAKYLQHVKSEIESNKQASQIQSFSAFCSARLSP